MSSSRTATRLLASVIVALAMIVALTPSASAVTWYPKFCTGFSGCLKAGYGNMNYSSVYKKSHWGQYSGHNCTNYVAYRMIQNGITQFITPGSGNATTWGAQAKKKGVEVDRSNPEVGDVAWWDNSIMGSSGHVAYVESVNRAAGTFVVSQDSWGGDFSWRTYKISEVSGFIHVGNKTPFGELNDLKSGTGQVTVRGWIIDMDKPTSAIKVRVYIGGVAGKGERHDLVADLKRSEIGAIYAGTGRNHGFKATLTTALKGTQKVYVYAVNTPSGTNPLIGQGTVTIADPDPKGSVAITTLPSQVQVTGTATDPNDTSAELTIQTYVGGKKGSAGAQLATTTTRNGSFSSTFTTSRLGSQPVHVYAVNTGPGSDRLLGSATVTVPDPLEFSDPGVSISGTAQVGKKLTAKASFTPGGSYTYQWYRDGRSISQATKSTYTLVGKDRGAVISVKATASKTGYATTTVASTATATIRAGAFASKKVTISGTAKVGRKLTAKPSYSPKASHIYQWYRDGRKISKATKSTYTLTAKDLGKKITVRTKGAATGYTSVKATSPSVKVAKGTSTITAGPTITGTGRVGRTLTVKTGSWRNDGRSLSVTWYRDGKKVKAGTATTYKLTSRDAGTRITAKVSYRRTAYTTVTKTTPKTAKITW